MVPFDVAPELNSENRHIFLLLYLWSQDRVSVSPGVSHSSCDLSDLILGLPPYLWDEPHQSLPNFTLCSTN